MLRVQGRVDDDQGEEETPFDTMDCEVGRWMSELTMWWHGGLGMQSHHVQERGRRGAGWCSGVRGVLGCSRGGEEDQGCDMVHKNGSMGSR